MQTALQYRRLDALLFRYPTVLCSSVVVVDADVAIGHLSFFFSLSLSYLTQQEAIHSQLFTLHT